MASPRRSAKNSAKPRPVDVVPGADPAWTTSDVAVYVGHAEPTVREWRKQEVGPPYFRTAGGQVRYRRSEVLAWEEASKVRH